MRFTGVILAAVLCLNAHADSNVKHENSDEDIVAAAEKLVAESKNEDALKAASTADTKAPIAAPAAMAADDKVAVKTDAATAAITQDAAKESEIPVFTKSEKVVKSEGTLIWRFAGSIAFIALIGGLMIFAGRRWKKDRNKGGEKARIEVLHQYHLGPKKSIALIRVAGEAILIGCTDQSVNMIKSIALIDDELDGENKDFNGFLDDDFTIEDMRSALQPRV